MTRPIWSLGEVYFVAEATLASQMNAVHKSVRLSTLLGVLVLIPECCVVRSQVICQQKSRQVRAFAVCARLTESKAKQRVTA